MKEAGVGALAVKRTFGTSFTIHLFPDAPEAEFIRATAERMPEENAESVKPGGGCALCGGFGRQRLIPGVCDACAKKEAIGG
jgi:hypothetical protein